MECGLSTGQGYSAPLFAGLGVGGGSASAVVDVCVATHMRGLVPHDRVCGGEERCRCLASSVAAAGCSQCSLGSLLASLRRCALLAEPLLVAATRSSRAPSSARRARGRRRPRRSCGACLGPRARASVVQPPGAAVGLGLYGLGFAGASAFEPDAPARRAALVPGGLDQQPAYVAGAGLGDRALTAPLAA
jgi:hypothetical protein